MNITSAEFSTSQSIKKNHSIKAKKRCTLEWDVYRLTGPLPVSPCFDTEVVVSMLPCHRYPSLALLVPPQANVALILSRTVAQFHPAGVHFVSTQTQLPDSCDQAASLSEEMEVLNEAAFSWFFFACVCLCEVWKNEELTVWELTESFELFFFWFMTELNVHGSFSLTDCKQFFCKTTTWGWMINHFQAGKVQFKP